MYTIGVDHRDLYLVGSVNATSLTQECGNMCIFIAFLVVPFTSVLL